MFLWHRFSPRKTLAAFQEIKAETGPDHRADRVTLPETDVTRAPDHKTGQKAPARQRHLAGDRGWPGSPKAASPG